MKSSCFVVFCVSAGTGMCGQGLKMLEMSFLGLLLAISAARGWKCSKLASWGYFSPYLQPGGWKCSKLVPGLTFGHICGQGSRYICLFLYKKSEQTVISRFRKCPEKRPRPKIKIDRNHIWGRIETFIISDLGHRRQTKFQRALHLRSTQFSRV